MNQFPFIRRIARSIAVHLVHACATHAYGGALVYFHPRDPHTKYSGRSEHLGPIPMSNPAAYSRRLIRREIDELESWLAAISPD